MDSKTYLGMELKPIKKSLFEYRLKSILKEAQDKSDLGVKRGSSIYKDLSCKGNKLFNSFSLSLKIPVSKESYPGLLDLNKMAADPEPINYKPVIMVSGLGIAGIGILVLGSSFVLALIHESYHGWIHLFHSIHL